LKETLGDNVRNFSRSGESDAKYVDDNYMGCVLFEIWINYRYNSWF